MAKFSSPGVFIQEIPKLPASVAEVATAIPAFIGYTENIGGTARTLELVPTRITSMLEYEAIFGGASKDKFNVLITDETANNAVTSRTVTVDRVYPTKPYDYVMYYSLQMFFANGGGPCYIVSIGDYSDSIDPSDFLKGIDTLEKIDEVTLIVFPDATRLNDEILYGGVVQKALAQCDKLQDRFVIADVPKDTVSVADIEAYREALGMEDLKYGASYMPFLKTTLTFAVDEDTSVILDHLGLITSTIDLQGKTLKQIKASDPSLYRTIIAEINSKFVTLPPSGAIAGIYARVDNDRGVWKAPANVSISGIAGPTVLITNAEQDGLNIDPTSGKSINAIRSFTGKGTLVWGSRTLAGNDNEWRYVPVRRFFNMAEESIKKATEFVVFEPNDANTWLRVKTMIENFLTNQWKQGALAGAKQDDAFFVNVGLGTTMTAQDILEGRMNVEIGMAVVRPAEFIILKFSHKLQQS